MAVQTITYSDKSYINENASISATNKITDSDMNEIKSVVNNNAGEFSALETTINSTIDGLFKIKYYESSITVGANSHATANLGSTPSIAGYTLFGIIQRSSGYGDQWVVSFSFYSGNVQAMVQSTYSSSLTNTVSCYVLYIKTDYFNTILVS